MTPTTLARSRIVFGIISLVAVSLVPLAVHAAVWDGRYPVDCNVSTDPCTLCEALQVAVNVIDFLTTIAGTIAIAMVVVGGFRLLTSAGSEKAYGEGKRIVTFAIVGLLIVLFSWVIVNTVLSLLSGGTLNLSNPVTCVDAPDPYTPELGARPLAVATGELPTPGGYTYDSGIQAQLSAASAPLSALLSCMQSRLPAGAKRISSISDSNGGVSCYQNHPTWGQCTGATRTNCCFHKKGSCHYGGSSCLGSSYAADFGNEQYGGDIRAAALACNSGAYVLQEGDHVHVSVGMASGCNCR
jgi:hypothetical protein